MSIERLQGTAPTMYAQPEQTAAKKAEETAQKEQGTAAAIYEKSTDTLFGNSKVDTATIERLKAEAEERTASLRNLVEKLILKQSGTSVSAEGGLAAMYRSLTVDAQTQAQAQEDIAEDGYWGVEQTSDRIVSFAQALAGNDKETAEKMLDAVKKGFGLAEDEWGEKLPDISQRTMTSTLDKMNEWIKSLNEAAAESTEAAVSVSENETE